MTINNPTYICTEYTKKTETDYSHLIGKEQDMWAWYKAVGLLGWALQNGIYNRTQRQKINTLREKTGICLIESIDGQERMRE